MTSVCRELGHGENLERFRAVMERRFVEEFERVGAA
jgi:hypothetical protein